MTGKATHPTLVSQFSYKPCRALYLPHATKHGTHDMVLGSQNVCDTTDKFLGPLSGVIGCGRNLTPFRGVPVVGVRIC